MTHTHIRNQIIKTMPMLNLDQLVSEDLTNLTRGIEKESLRINPTGRLSQQPHPGQLGSALTHPNITTDFSEAQLELITDTHNDVGNCLNQLRQVHQFVSRNISSELLWCSSMPCMLPEDSRIPIAQFGHSNIATAKTVYRRGLALRYGAKMQTISGIHYNFSISNETWARIYGRSNDRDDLIAIKNQHYFSLIRNFRKHAWLLLYLFGASPAVCDCFVNGRVHHLNKMANGTHSLPYATSLRMGPLGYQSDVQSSISVSYNNLTSYARSLYDALTQPYPPYAAIGLTDGKNTIQLSNALLQIENEFYGTIRPKQPVQYGERPLLALNRRGVEYVEVRCLDLDPYQDIGISKETIAFLDTFLLFCLLSKSSDDSTEENRSNSENQYLIAERGRDPSLKLTRDKDFSSVKSWGADIIEACQPFALKLDEANQTSIHMQSLANAAICLDNPEETPSARVLQDIEEKHNGSYFNFIMSLSSEYTERLKQDTLSKETLTDCENNVKLSITKHQSVERDEQLDFEEFRKEYVSQEASRIILEERS
jgi:glutamate--cysteine ligase